MSVDHNPKDLTSIPLDEILAARERLRCYVVQTPLVRLNCDTDNEIYLKLENLQKTGAFKIRSAGNALLSLPETERRVGIHCPSSGNFGIGLSYMARHLDVPTTIILPNTVQDNKVKNIRKYGATVKKVPYDKWRQTMKCHRYESEIPGRFLHPSRNILTIAGSGTIGLEILEDMPDVDVITMPFGGGSLVCGVASAVKAYRPEVQVVACEVEGAAPLTHALHMNQVEPVPSHRVPFTQGIGGTSVIPEMWNLSKNLVDDTAVISEWKIVNTIRMLLDRNKILAEGAGAVSVAAALSPAYAGKKVVAVVSGGNMDSSQLIDVLNGNIPQ